MKNIDSLEKIIKYQQNKDVTYLSQEHLLMQLCIRANKKLMDNMSAFLDMYGINYSKYMVLVTLFTADNYCLSPSEIGSKLQFTRTNITRITDFLEKAGYIKRSDDIMDRRVIKIKLTSAGILFIQRITLAQNMHLKEIWSFMTSDECEVFEVINKKLLKHLSSACL